MQLGIALPQCGPWATPDDQRTVAVRAEELGLASVWTFQRLLATPGLPYQDALDPLVSLTFVAGVTDRIRLCVSLLNAPYAPAVLLAKQLASLDVLSRGRLDVGLGVGWLPAEFAALGVPYDERGARTDEALAALTALWQDDPVTLHGRFATVEEGVFRPKPVQRPRPPLLVGGSSAATVRRVVGTGDGWLSSSRMQLSEVADFGRRLREAAADAGREPNEIRIVVRGVVRLVDQPLPEDDRASLHGSLDQILDDLARYEQAGATELFADLNYDPSIGGPDGDPQRGRDVAEQLMAAFAAR